jgi:3',5'-cyclic AMP phosphodiesterase CpdA
MMMQRRLRLALAIGIALCTLILASTGLYGVTGTVYIDRNNDLQYDNTDLLLSGVVVSDGVTVVSTDDKGVFTLEPDLEAKFVFICTPSGTRPLDGWYRDLAEGKPLNFPLEEVADDSPLVFVQLSDPHYATDPDEFKKAFYDRRMKVLPETVFDKIVPEVNDLGPDFVILTGDIVADSKRPDISLVDKWMNYMGTDFAPRFSAPFYATVGNHDVVRDETVDKAIYERYFGPTYYSFNVKGVHFVVLDTQQLVGTSLVYTVTPAQLSWLKQDLAAADPGSPIVVFCHEPSPNWAETPENEALLDLLQQTGITALLSGHWHTNFLLQRYPFYELTSGAICASWWEGAAPDGTEFGYRVYRIVRGILDSIWRDAGLNSVEFHLPQRVVIQWTERLQAAVWGDATRASLSIDDAEAIETPVFYNSLWTTAYGNLNLSTLEDGDHSLTVTFYMADGSTVESIYPFYVCNPDLTIEEIKERIETFQGKIVAAPRLVVKAIIGSDISASDGTKTIIISKFPYPVEKNDVIGIVGIYRATSTAPIKAYDPIFFTKYDEAAD